MTAAEILRGAAALIAGKNAWTQNVYARDHDGEECWSTADDASCWCMDGALKRVGMGKAGYQGAVTVLIQACGAGKIGGRDLIHEFNDVPNRRQEECVAKLLEAAELAERR